MKTALVVDDEPLIRRQVAETLASYGFEEIIEAENGKAALDLATARKPLLIVMDVSMPVMDGITAAEKIGKIVSAPIVLLTGTADPATGIRQFTVGTGGAGLYAFGPPLPNSESRGVSRGVLKLTLRDTAYDWVFVPIAGETFTDTGSGSCH